MATQHPGATAASIDGVAVVDAYGGVHEFLRHLHERLSADRDASCILWSTNGGSVDIAGITGLTRDDALNFAWPNTPSAAGDGPWHAANLYVIVGCMLDMIALSPNLYPATVPAVAHITQAGPALLAALRAFYPAIIEEHAMPKLEDIRREEALTEIDEVSNA